jgi:predicted dehydrogenase
VLAVGGGHGPVENEDHVAALLRLASGARAVLEASRVAVGEQNTYGFEVHGTAGRLAWDFRRMGELAVGRGGTAQDQPVSTVFVGPGDGSLGAFQPGAGMAMGYDDLKVIEARDFLRSIAEGRSSGTELADAVRAAVTLDALVASAADRRWVDVPIG